MLLGAVADVGVPAVAGVARGQPLHQAVAHGLGQDGGGGDGLAARVAVDQRLVGVADLGQREAVDEDAVARRVRSSPAGRRETQQPGDGAAHGERAWPPGC